MGRTTTAQASWSDIQPTRVYWQGDRFEISYGAPSGVVSQELVAQLRQIPGATDVTGPGMCNSRLSFRVDTRKRPEEQVLADVNALVNPRYTGEAELVLLVDPNASLSGRQNYQVLLRLDQRPQTEVESSQMDTRIRSTNGVVDVGTVDGKHGIQVILSDFHRTSQVRAERVGRKVAEALGLEVTNFDTEEATSPMDALRSFYGLKNTGAGVQEFSMA